MKLQLANTLEWRAGAQNSHADKTLESAVTPEKVKDIQIWDMAILNYMGTYIKRD